MADPLPSLNALRVFTSAARHLSFTRTAQELHVTQTAVSHQIRRLETELGVKLFERSPGRLQLTPEGQAYAGELGRVFERIGDATAALKSQPRREVLAVTCMPSFCARWLVPRLGRFTARHPDVDVRLGSTERPVDLTHERFDVGIRWGYGRYVGLASEKLMDDACFPVCSPKLIGSRPGRGGALDLRRVPLLHDDSPDAWRRWLRTAGMAEVDPERGHIFNDANLVLLAAADGLGVALARRSLVREDLRTRRLVRPFPLSVPTAQAYFLVSLEHTTELPRVKAFRSWLVDEVSLFGADRERGKRVSPFGVRSPAS